LPALWRTALLRFPGDPEIANGLSDADAFRNEADSLRALAEMLAEAAPS
jgi:hypothetical protein